MDILLLRWGSGSPAFWQTRYPGVHGCHCQRVLLILMKFPSFIPGSTQVTLSASPLLLQAFSQTGFTPISSTCVYCVSCPPAGKLKLSHHCAGCQEGKFELHMVAVVDFDHISVLGWKRC